MSENKVTEKKTKRKVPSYEELSTEAITALRAALGEDAVITTNRGYQGRVQIDLISPRLNGMRERQKQDFLWELLDGALGEKTRRISFILGYGTNENYP